MVYSHGSSIVLAIVMTSLAWISCLLRYYTRIWIVKKFRLDDWLSVIGLASAPSSNHTLLVLTRVACQIIATMVEGFGIDGYFNGGEAIPISAIPNPSLTYERGFRDLFASEICFTTAAAVIKISFAVTLLHIVQRRAHRIWLYVVIGVTAFFGVGFIFDTVFTCLPVDYAWKQTLDPYNIALALGLDPVAKGFKPRGWCRPTRLIMPFTYLQNVLIIVIDINICIILPIIVVRDLMQPRLKVTVGVLLALSTLATVASIVRLAYVPEVAAARNILYSGNPLLVWCGVELQLYFVASSLPMLKPLTDKLGLTKKDLIEPALHREWGAESDDAAHSAKPSDDGEKQRDVEASIKGLD